ncbi:DUF2975 domain-containing protein [Streptomyces sp. NPDC021093]|uniref:DUF2975 domain-containing protein n=1 Tax=Streptomyces sp. NPDC021093 TaxID=3365112 RepID=UPI0037A8DB04
MNNTSWWTRANDHILELALGLALLLVALFRVLFPVLGIADPWSPADSRTVRVDDAAQLPEAAASGTAASGTAVSGTATSGTVTLRGSGHAELVLTDAGLGDRLLLALPGVVGGLLLIAVLAVLLRMARTFRVGDFFVPRNTWRLTAIAGALVLMGTLVPLLGMMTTNLLVRGTPLAEAIRPAEDYAVLPVFLALLVGAVAQAFHSGTRLRADTDGLV